MSERTPYGAATRSDRLIPARRGAAEQGEARLGAAGLGKAWLGLAGQGPSPSEAETSRAGLAESIDHFLFT